MAIAPFGDIDHAARGRKNEAIRGSLRAMELLPMEKDFI